MSLVIRLLREPKRMVARLLELLWGAAATSTPGRAARRLALSTYEAADWPSFAAGLVAHVYYSEVMAEIIAAHALLPPGSPLIVTAPSNQIDAIRAACPTGTPVRLFEVPNQGRDVAPFVMLLNNGVFDGIDVLLKLHSKKSPHLIGGDLRRRMIFHSLAGDVCNVKRIQNHFASERVGLVGMRSLFRSRPSFWMANKERVAEVCARMKPPASVNLGFFEGTMFWIRVAALDPLRGAGIALDEFEAEAGQLDGTLHHAIERALPLSVIAAGYDIRDVAGRPLQPAHTASAS